MIAIKTSHLVPRSWNREYTRSKCLQDCTRKQSSENLFYPPIPNAEKESSPSSRNAYTRPFDAINNDCRHICLPECDLNLYSLFVEKSNHPTLQVLEGRTERKKDGKREKVKEKKKKKQEKKEEEEKRGRRKKRGKNERKRKNERKEKRGKEEK